MREAERVEAERVEADTYAPALHSSTLSAPPQARLETYQRLDTSALGMETRDISETRDMSQTRHI
jgi:hypothetical protein